MEHNMSDTQTPAANSTEAFAAAVAAYRQQHAAGIQQLDTLEKNYASQKDQIKSNLLMLMGAIAAIEQLMKNVEDEAKANAEAVKEAAIVVMQKDFDARNAKAEVPTDPNAGATSPTA
jgi:hypothetical protein